jgi:hypothetical protein
MGTFKMDITTILICIITSTGFIIGQIIKKKCKEEAEKGKKIITTIKEITFASTLFILFTIFNINKIISAALSITYLIYAYLRKKNHKKINIIIISATLASTFRTEYFIYTGGMGLIYSLFNGIQTENMKKSIKKSIFFIILSLFLIYLRTL